MCNVPSLLVLSAVLIEYLQVKAILAELDRLEVDFANSLAKLRNEYDVRKAALQAQLRACADKRVAVIDG